MKPSFILKQERQALVDEARAEIEIVESEKRDFTPEEKTAQEERMAKIGQLSETIKEREALENLQDVDSRDLPEETETPEVRETPEEKELRELGETLIEKRDYTSAMNSGIFQRTVVDSKVREGLPIFSQVRSVANVTTTASNLVIPVDAGDVSVDLIAEGGEYPDGGGTLKDVKFKPLKVGAIVKLTDEALQDIPANLAENTIKQLQRAMGKKENLWFLTGNGTTQPEGIVTGASKGEESAANTAITAGELRGLITSVPTELLPNSYGWCTKTTMGKLLDLNDKNKNINIVFNPVTRMYEVLGIPFFINNNMDEIGASKKPLVIGDSKNFYEIKDRTGYEVKVLQEKYADFGKIGFRFTFRTDAHVMDSEAFKYLEMPA